MTLIQAKALRDEITAKTGAYCTVPLGYKPDRYFCRIFRSEWSATGGPSGPAHPIDFQNRQEWLIDFEDQQRRKRERDEYFARQRRRALSPIEMLIDQACGFKPEASGQ